MISRETLLSGNAAKGSAISQGISLLGTAGGIAASIMLTPLLFGLTEHWLSNYLTDTWGGFGSVLLVVMGAIWAVALYALIKILVISALTAAIVALAVRRIPLS